jgi:hypothetical protein
LGGGIWRMKWHPITPNRMLVAAMHAGCRVLNFGGGNSFDGVPGALTWSSSKDSSFGSSGGGAAEALYHPQMLSGERVGMKYKKTKEFTEHESMAYGADWFVYPHPTQNGYFEAAARYVCETVQAISFSPFNAAARSMTEPSSCGIPSFEVLEITGYVQAV